MKWRAGVVLIVSLLTLAVRAETNFQGVPTDLETHIPEFPAWLFEKSFFATLDTESEKQRYADQRFREWLAMILAPEFCPPEEAVLIFSRNAIGESGVVSCEWSAKNFRFRSVQTLTTLTLRITPINSEVASKRNEPTVAWIRQTFALCWPRETITHTSGGEAVALPMFDHYVSENFFDKVRELDSDNHVAYGRASGTPLLRSLMSIPAFPKMAERRDKNWSQIYDGDDRAWYRTAAWWCDGTSLGIYFCKLEPGSPCMIFMGMENVDRQWF